MSPKSDAFPCDAIVTKFIVLTLLSFPPANIPRLVDEKLASLRLVKVKSPKSCELPVVEILTK